MDIRDYLPCIEFICQKAWTAKKHPQSNPQFTVELIYILEILKDILPERLFGIQGILAAIVTIHSFKDSAAIAAVPICGDTFPTHSS